MTENIYKPEGCLIGTMANDLHISSLEGLQKAFEEGRILEAPVISCSRSLDLTVELGNIKAIIPHDEVELPPVKDIAAITRVGKSVAFKVMNISSDIEQNILLSRRLAQLEAYENHVSKLKAGDIIDVSVTHLEHFGAFVDIGCGIISLLPIDCTSVSRISHPRERLSVGNIIRAVVKKLEYDDNGKLSRIFVSRRELLGTWEENALLFEVGQTVTGIVRGIESYGVFVELTPNLAGLAEHIDGEELVPGQGVAVYIKSFIPEKMKVKLAIVDSFRGILPKNEYKTFISDDVRHIDRWVYSPSSCERVIQSEFI